ncbi:MAG: bestrophin family ion channel [Ferruginibacter sp.]|nr:multidrug transporter [Chitinophagaceae bacterium]
MHSGKQYSFKEVILWTRKDIYFLLVVATIPTCCYVLLDWKWLAIPWLPIALLGTAVAFVVGFKNNASYDRVWEARRIWGAIINASRGWGIMVKDYVSTKHAVAVTSSEELKNIHQQLIYRHFAWVTALRYQLREPRVWEAVYQQHNAEYKDKYFTVDEHQNKIDDALKPYLTDEEYKAVMGKTNRAAQILALQSTHLHLLLDKGLIEDFRHMELERILIELYNQQGGSERIKNFPYPRQYATLNKWFIKVFIVLLPLGMLQEFEKLGGLLIWLSIPFSALASWVFTTMERIGESSESPFEGSANDVPITAMSRTIEIDLREMFGMTDIPPAIKPVNNLLT